MSLDKIVNMVGGICLFIAVILTVPIWFIPWALDKVMDL